MSFPQTAVHTYISIYKTTTDICALVSPIFIASWDTAKEIDPIHSFPGVPLPTTVLLVRSTTQQLFQDINLVLFVQMLLESLSTLLTGRIFANALVTILAVRNVS